MTKTERERERGQSSSLAVEKILFYGINGYRTSGGASSHIRGILTKCAQDQELAIAYKIFQQEARLFLISSSAKSEPNVQLMVVVVVVNCSANGRKIWGQIRISTPFPFHGMFVESNLISSLSIANQVSSR